MQEIVLGEQLLIDILCGYTHFYEDREGKNNLIFKMSDDCNSDVILQKVVEKKTEELKNNVRMLAPE